MQKAILSIAVGIALFSCSEAPKDSATSAQPTPAATDTAVATASTESQRLSAYFESAFEQDLRRSPVSQSYLGYKWDYDQWDEVTTASQNEDIAIAKQRLKDIKTFDLEKLSESERLSLRLFQLGLERTIQNDEFRLQHYIMQQFRGYHTMVPSFLINIHRVSDVADAEAYIARLNAVDELFAQVVEQLEMRTEKGVFPPQWAYDQMITAANNVITGAPFEGAVNDSTLLADFKSKVESLELSAEEEQRLITQAISALKTSVQPAYQQLIAALTAQKPLSPAGDGVWRLPDGDAWYQNRLNWYTTTDMTAKQIHELGLAEVQRIHNAMQDIMKQVEFDGTLQEFFTFMRDDPQFYYDNTDEGRARYMREAKAYIDAMEEKIPDYFGLIPQADMVIKRVEAFREQSAGKAFYQSPAKDGSRPGIYYANLYDMGSMPTYQMEALAFHEGIPGHHMQRAITQELEGIPEFQKYLSFTAYTEGWGLYTEELGKDMGFYQDPYSDFGRLAMELWRACRLVVDTGLHSSDYKWSREKAVAYLVENTPNPTNDAQKAIERYIALPGQATAYLVGKIKIMELRQRAMDRLGDEFDWRGFHDEILRHGPIPLNILEEKIDAWIASNEA